MFFQSINSSAYFKLKKVTGTSDFTKKYLQN